MLRALVVPAAVLATALVCAQTLPPANGPQARRDTRHAFINATVHVSPTEVIKGGMVLVEGERIVSVGPRTRVPEGAVVHDLAGAHLWPALVDPYSDLGMPEPASKDRGTPAATGARHWNGAIRATTAAAHLYRVDADRTAKLRAAGVGAVLTHRMDGIVRGTGAVVLTAGREPARDILVPAASAHFSFRKGSSPDSYPSSLMGSIALWRQTLLDARWYQAGGHQQARDLELEALAAQLTLPLVFEASEREDVSRIAALGREFGLRFLIREGGDAYARRETVAATSMPLIVPLTFPDAPEVADPFDALEVSLARMKHWELAPHNARLLHEAGVPFAFTTHGLKEPAEVWPALRRVLLGGLDTATVLAAVTTRPAELLGVGEHLGTIVPGRLANLLITSAHLLDEKNVLYETWVAGQRSVHDDRTAQDPRGVYDLNIAGRILRVEVSGTRQAPEFTARRTADDTVKVPMKATREGDRLSLVTDGDKLGLAGLLRLNGLVHQKSALWDGQAQLADGRWVPWSAVKQVKVAPKGEKERKEAKLDSLYRSPPGAIWYPMGAYGSPSVVDSGTILFKGATVWTNGPQGVLRGADVLVHEGRILTIGRDLDATRLFPAKRMPPVTVIQAQGMHLTSGIIDEHSHIGIRRGVNEGGQAISSEVRIGDVIDPDAVALYRALAGGVTAVQQLHGSANPIGGQSALIKLRWGRPADALPIAGAEGRIKFALGENVKQSGSPWGDRYPRSRMGVEQLFYDAFHRAREYGQAWREYDMLKPRDRERAVPPRRDLELDALLEILEGRRHISCHSYVQSEIDMLIHVADSMRFQVNTFTHILEGYKVAAKMKAHGASASSFSDWWAYKYEVYEAIPYNAALLWRAGVNTGINSDDAEMCRRLNQEAAKTMKYGGVPPEEAWKMVTLNPARMLKLDHRTGSIEPGKDADLVLWTHDPLSIDARVEMTVVDGMPVFSRQRDEALRTAMEAERQRLIARINAYQTAGGRTAKAGREREKHWHCDSEGEEP